MPYNITECFSTALNSGAITSIKFNSHGDRIAVGTSVGHLFIFTEENSEPSVEFPPSDGPINQVTWDPTSLYIYAVTEAGSLWQYNTETLLVTRIFSQPKSPLLSCASSSANSYISIGSTKGELSIFKSTDIINTSNFYGSKENSKYEDFIQTVKGHSDAITAICFNSEGELILTGSYDSLVRFWTTDLVCIRSLSFAKPVCSMSFLTAKTFFLCTSDNSVKMVTLQGHIKRNFSVLLDSSFPIGCSALNNEDESNQSLVLGFSCGAILILHQKEKNEVAFYSHEAPFYSFDTHPSSMIIATGGGQNEMNFKLWKVTRIETATETANGSLLMENDPDQQVFNNDEFPMDELDDSE